MKLCILSSISLFKSLCIVPVSWIGGCFEGVKARSRALAYALANFQVLKHYGYIWIVLSLFLVTGCQRDKGFSLKKVTSYHTPLPEWEVHPCLLPPLEELTSEPFTYLGSGNHTYAFMSQDGQYVLKFFKQKHMKTTCWADYLPFPAKRLFYPTQKIERRMALREKTYASYKTAFHSLREETGLLYLHLNSTPELPCPVTLIDQKGRKVELDLGKMEFLIQKKATLAFDFLANLLEEKRDQEAIESALSLLKIIHKRSKLGLYDKDLQLFKNFGFVEGKGIEIDIGEFRSDIPPKQTKEDLDLVAGQIMTFFERHSPDLKNDVEENISKWMREVQ